MEGAGAERSSRRTAASALPGLARGSGALWAGALPHTPLAFISVAHRGLVHAKEEPVRQSVARVPPPPRSLRRLSSACNVLRGLGHLLGRLLHSPSPLVSPARLCGETVLSRGLAV